MSLKIRLARGGRKKKPFYSIVVAENTSPRDGKFIEKLGTFNPLLAKDKAERVVLKADRIEYWLGKGAEPTETIARHLQKLNVGQAFTQVKKLNARQAKVVEFKKKELEAKRKAEEEKARKEAEAAAKEAAEKAAAEAEAAKAAAEAAAAAPAEGEAPAA